MGHIATTFWRPLLINDHNIKIVIETTCRLHNLCIDVKRGGTFEDYIYHDDIYWQRVAASIVSRRSRRRLFTEETPLELEPTYAKAQTIAAITGVRADAPARTVR